MSFVDCDAINKWLNGFFSFFFNRQRIPSVFLFISLVNGWHFIDDFFVISFCSFCCSSRAITHLISEISFWCDIFFFWLASSTSLILLVISSINCFILKISIECSSLKCVISSSCLFWEFLLVFSLSSISLILLVIPSINCLKLKISIECFS